MPTFRESIWPILIIIITSTILMLLIAPLDSTEWATGIRAGLITEGDESFEASDLSGAISIIGPFLKITFLMGIPALITFWIRRIIRRFQMK